MAEVHPLNDDEHEELISYLAGELEQCDPQAVETRIAKDASFRAEADAQRKTWDMLDYLPKPEPSPNFTHRTVSRLAALQPSPGRFLARRTWLMGLSWAAALLLALGAGYAAAPLFWSRPQPLPEPLSETEQMVRDLRVLEQLRLFQHVPDIHFLNELDRFDLFGDDFGF